MVELNIIVTVELLKTSVTVSMEKEGMLVVVGIKTPDMGDSELDMLKGVVESTLEEEIVEEFEKTL